MKNLLLGASRLGENVVRQEIDERLMGSPRKKEQGNLGRRK